ncbi:MAG: Ltp family lipoprotein [Acetatifactor sp.]|nr:Ltp family lipoprotein [Acetatifactor sp.]
MVLGIIALLLSFILIGGVIGIVGIILSIIGVVAKDKKHGLAIAGIVLNAIAIFIMILILAFLSLPNNLKSINSPGEITESAEDNVPKAYKSALNKAISYNETMPMSKAEIYDMLRKDFTADAAQYAIDNLNVDWKENALFQAQKYDEVLHLSKAGLYDQLRSDYGGRFTAEEAQYAVDNIKADWKNNALIIAKKYQKSKDVSPDDIYDWLTSYAIKFTAEEAQYAIDNLN